MPKEQIRCSCSLQIYLGYSFYISPIIIQSLAIRSCVLRSAISGGQRSVL
jgi:hypothetical protein